MWFRAALVLVLLVVAHPARAEDAVATQVDAVLAGVVPAGGPGGVVEIVRRGEVIARRAYGLASIELGVAIRPEHRFRIASISKQITAVAILRLVEAGKLALDAPITRYLHNAPASWQPITLAHLLNHTSGLPSAGDVSPEVKAAILGVTTGDELITRLGQLPVHDKPGAAYAYNNWGYGLLGQILEGVAGTSYCTHVHDTLFVPLGMTQTQCPDGRAPIAGMVNGYESREHGTLATPESPLARSPLFPAGGLVSTADDLVRWTRALHGGKLVAPASYARMITATRLASGEIISYGFGTRLRTVDGHALVISNGDGPGQHSEIAFDRATDTIAIGLYNFGPSYAYLSRRLLAISRGKPLAAPPAAQAPPASLAALAGNYAGGDRPAIAVELDAGALYVRRQSSPDRLPLVAVAPLTFRRDPDDDTRYRFVADHDKITAVRVSTDGSPGDTLQPRLP